MTEARHDQILAALSAWTDGATDPRGKSITRQQVESALKDLEDAAFEQWKVLVERSEITRNETSAFLTLT